LYLYLDTPDTQKALDRAKPAADQGHPGRCNVFLWGRGINEQRGDSDFYHRLLKQGNKEAADLLDHVQNT